LGAQLALQVEQSFLRDLDQDQQGLIQIDDWQKTIDRIRTMATRAGRLRCPALLL